MKKMIGHAAAVIAFLLVAAGADAQVFTPTYMSPAGLNDIGVYFSDGPGDYTLEGIWRGGPLGLRVGFVDRDADDLLSVGGELRSQLGMANPFDLAFTLGAQGLVGDASAVGVQAGLSAGHRFVQPGLALTPYLHPRIALLNGFAPDDDFELEVLADLGLDLEFPSNLIVRVSAGLGARSPNWGVGVAWRR